MTSGAAYMRAYRRRMAAGKACVVVEVDEDDIAMLVEAKVLDGRQDQHTREAIAAAVRAFLKISREA